MTTPEDSTLPAAGPETPVAATEPPARTDDQGSDQPPDHDAARYRRQLRETEAETAGLRTKLEGLQRNQVEAMARSANVEVPASIWAGGLKVADLLDDNGMVDNDLALDAIAASIASLGLATRSVVRPDMSQGARGPAEPDASFWQLLKGE